jgi:methionyl-tRNA formyltransferase
MRVLFFGTSPFAVPTLRALHEAAPRHSVIGVVTQPDRPQGRGRKVGMSPVKETALRLGYFVHQPERVRRRPFPETVAALAPDALVVVAFGQIIPQALLDLPRFGGVNVHASLLPRWRGAAPIHHALMAGDPETGVATMRMEATLDTGPTFLVAREPIRPDDNVGTLEPRLAALGAPLLVETLDRLEAGRLDATPQDEAGVTLAPPVTREMGFLDPRSETAEALARRVRGTTPRPGAFLLIAGGRLVKVLEARAEPAAPGGETALPPGTISALPKEGVAIATTGGGTFLLTRVQPEGRSAMPAADWARGTRLAPGDVFSRPGA